MAAIDEEEDIYDDELSRLAALPTPDLSGVDEEAPDPLSAPVPAGRQPIPVNVPATNFPARGNAAAAYQPKPTWDWRRAMVAAGKGDVGAYDRNKAAHAAEFEQKRMLRAMLDPMSPESKREQENYKALVQGLAQAPGVPEQFRAYLKGEMTNADALPGLKAKASGERLQKVFASVLKGSEVETRQRRADQQQEYQNLMLQATQGNQQAMRELQRQGLWQNDRHFNIEQERKRAADAARAKANRIRLQMKRIDPKAQEELQALNSMDRDLKEVEALLPGAYTGPGAATAVGAADAVEAVTGAAEKMTGLPVTVKKPESLASTQKIQSLVENAIADVRKQRFGSSLTAGESKALNEWKPGVQLSEESNRNLIAALRKHASFRAQGKVRQLFQNIGMPIHLPKDTYLPLDAQIELKNEFDAMNQYDDESLAESEDVVNDILRPYGGYVGHGGGGTTARAPRPTAAPAAAPTPAAAKPKTVIQNGHTYTLQPDGTYK